MEHLLLEVMQESKPTYPVYDGEDSEEEDEGMSLYLAACGE